MRFDIDRMCNLAGLGKSTSSARTSGLLRESAYDEGMDDLNEEDLEEIDQLEAADFDEMDEIVEVDEATLVQELRRMKKIVTEARSKAKSVKRKRKENLQEAQLKAIIDQEVKNVLNDLNLNSGWMYGNKRPTRSKKGYLNHGSMIKGIGFK